MICIMSKIKGTMCKRVTNKGEHIDSIIREGL